jgi:hypothetical protein
MAKKIQCVGSFPATKKRRFLMMMRRFPSIDTTTQQNSIRLIGLLLAPTIKNALHSQSRSRCDNTKKATKQQQQQPPPS